MPNELSVNAGALEIFSLNGNEVAIDFGFNSRAMSDANYTVLDSEYKKSILKFTGTLGATRNIVLPTTAGAIFIIDNQTTQSLVIKTSGGTGPTIATTKKAIVYCDGTDYVRVTADA